MKCKICQKEVDKNATLKAVNIIKEELSKLGVKDIAEVSIENLCEWHAVRKLLRQQLINLHRENEERLMLKVVDFFTILGAQIMHKMILDVCIKEIQEMKSVEQDALRLLVAIKRLGNKRPHIEDWEGEMIQFLYDEGVPMQELAYIFKRSLSTIYTTITAYNRNQK